MILLHIIVTAMLVVGLLFFLGATIGLLRFPDFYTRMHAAGKGDTLSSMMMLAALALLSLQEPTLAHCLVALKILGISLFILITSPTSTHALMHAGRQSGIKPWRKPPPLAPPS